MKSISVAPSKPFSLDRSETVKTAFPKNLQFPLGCLKVGLLCPMHTPKRGCVFGVTVLLPEAFSGDPEEVVTPRENLLRVNAKAAFRAAAKAAVREGLTAYLG